MTLKHISKRFFAKFAKFQKNTKGSVPDSTSLNINVENYANNNENESIVLMKGITCRFGNLVANHNITFDLKKREIHALLGENGAGKTTLTSILFGLYQPESGEIYVKGQHAVIKSPSDAINLGIAMVHQHFLLTLAHSVTENIIVGLKPTRGIFLNLHGAEEKITQISKKYGLQVDPKSIVGNLSVGEQQRVEILKALYRDVDILILDEPTGMLTPMEENVLFKSLRSMVNQGLSIIFITHKLREVMEVSNRVTVLRGGNVIGTVKTSDTNELELARMMVGRTVTVNEINRKKVLKTTSPTVLEIKNVSSLGNSNILLLKDICLDLRKGEILGVAGVDGNGQNELAEVIAGLRRVRHGQISIDGRSITNLSPRQIRQLGLAYVPEDCLHTGLILEYSIVENLVLDRWYTKPYANKLFLNKMEMMKFAHKIIEGFDIKITELNAPVSSMSGGNLQKIVLGRELSRNPKLLIVHNPTRGLDIGATDFIHKQLIAQKENGVGVLLLSLDLDEVLRISDRIAVIYEGKIITIVEKQDADIDQIGLLMGGKAIRA